MELIRALESLSPELRGGAVAIGNFDGVHRGHARIMRQLCERARELSGPAVVFTFDPHPVLLLRPQQAPPPLTWTERKAELISTLGVDAVVVYPTDEELLSLTSEAFFSQIIQGKLAASAMVEGPNFRFGRGRAGDISTLKQLCSETNISLEVVSPIMLDNEYISSSRIRSLVRDGNLDLANRMLIQPYRIRGLVTHGVGRGHRIGFPTANLGAVDTLLPASGVYAGRAKFGDRLYPAAINIGSNPTFGEDKLKVEVHLVDFQGTLYGETLEVDFLCRLRDTRPFDSVEQLKRQLERDIQSVRRANERNASD